MSHFSSVDELILSLQKRDPSQPEFIQAVREMFVSIWPFLQQNPRYMTQNILERITEPERIIQFRVTWIDDKGNIRVNRAWRVQFNSAIGPYKGGLRFHPSVNVSILKFLGFEQTFKNALTMLPMGGAKGGADFDPKGKSDGEIMRFCQAMILEMHRHIGSNTDIPAGDIGVGSREIGYMAGMMKKISNDVSCVFTGKALSYGGSHIRSEATGYGLIYFVQEMLQLENRTIEGMRISVSGAGNVAQYTIAKAIELGAKVVTISDSGGTIIDETGFTLTKLNRLLEIINVENKRLPDYAKEFNLKYITGIKPWHIPVDIALPCATQNEMTLDDAKILIKNGVYAVAEGANMPVTIEATTALIEAGVLFAPGKAANAGGVATSGLEIAQNASRLSWESHEVDRRLYQIMQGIHSACVEHGSHNGRTNYVMGANIASFIKVANAMKEQGVV